MQEGHFKEKLSAGCIVFPARMVQLFEVNISAHIIACQG